ncbi:MAG: putative addiction module antidote protein [Gammaproteobacteria bacterium]|nr:MAG: putative addiction module antidote protein [Gammaproteobacteria bacterium]
MTGKIRVSELPDFDVTEYLEDDQAIAEYLTCVLEDGDPNLLVAALGDIARARGMTDIARETGLAREALYRALREGASPRFDTVMRVLRALGVRLVAEPERNHAA